eukprot:COSAG03_NODE_9_length_23924_cov_40.675690_18_plen_106_part_00
MHHSKCTYVCTRPVRFLSAQLPPCTTCHATDVARVRAGIRGQRLRWTPSARQVLDYNLGKKGLVELTPLAFMILMAAAGGCPGVNIVLSTMGQFVPRLTKTFVSA